MLILQGQTQSSPLSNNLRTLPNIAWSYYGAVKSTSEICACPCFQNAYPVILLSNLKLSKESLLLKSCPCDLMWGPTSDSAQKKKQEKKKENGKYHQKKDSAWLVISPAESLNSIPIKEIVVSGNWRNVNGKLGILKEKESQVSVDISLQLITSVCSDKTRVSPQPQTHPPAQTPTFSLHAPLMKS